jgi:hypothetical protein
VTPHTLLACVACALAAGHAQAACTVLDEEMKQGAYQGGCRGGLAHGKGVATGFARYEGEFRKGRKHGYGVKTWPWGDRYSGTFRDDQKDGRGLYEWGAGSRWAGERYLGEFKRDRRNGEGVYTWPNGDRFEGQWKDDQRIGMSVMERRRNLAQTAWRKAFTDGTVVCSLHLSEGAVREGTVLKGVVAGFDGSILEVRLQQAGASAHRPAPVLAEDPSEWSPCS